MQHFRVGIQGCQTQSVWLAGGLSQQMAAGTGFFPCPVILQNKFALLIAEGIVWIFAMYFGFLIGMTPFWLFDNSSVWLAPFMRNS